MRHLVHIYEMPDGSRRIRGVGEDAEAFIQSKRDSMVWIEEPAPPLPVRKPAIVPAMTLQEAHARGLLHA